MRKKLLSAIGLLSLAAAKASAQLVYEPFNYTAGSALDNQLNPTNGETWSKMSANVADDDILLTSGSLSFTGLAAPIGNSVSYSGSGKTESLAIGPVISSGIAYYSLTFQVTNTSGLTSSPVFIGGFGQDRGSSSFQPTSIGSRLYLRAGSVGGTFQIGISKNSSAGGDIVFDTTQNFAASTPVFVVGSYKINGTTLGTDDEARLYINPTSSLGADSPPSTTLISTGGTDLFTTAPAVASFLLRQGLNVPPVQVDELRIDTNWAQVTPPAGTSWDVDGDGDWAINTNWSPTTVPDGSLAFVNFGAKITLPHTVTINSARAVRTLNFNNSKRYTLAGSGPINFSATGAVNVFSGSHTIATPITFAGDFEANVATASTLTVSGNITANGFNVAKNGAGNLEVNNLRAGALTINGGTVKVLPNGGDSGTSVLTAVNLPNSGAATGYRGTLDLTNNDLIVRSTSSTDAADYAALRAAIKSGLNASATVWAGKGITSSTAAADSSMLTAVGIILNDAASVSTAGLSGGGPIYTAFSGQSVGADDILIKFTYFGDNDLSGSVDSTDYSLTDNGFLTRLVNGGWLNGDFDYSGSVDSTDYSLQDAAFLNHSPPLGPTLAANTTSPLPGVTPIPEPAAFAAVFLSFAAFLAPRRRRI